VVFAYYQKQKLTYGIPNKYYVIISKLAIWGTFADLSVLILADSVGLTKRPPSTYLFSWFKMTYYRRRRTVYQMPLILALSCGIDWGVFPFQNSCREMG